MSSTAANMPSWTIRDLADMLGLTPRALRFYEDKGLISPKREGQNRIYGPRERARLDHIMRGKRLGFSLDDIRDVLDIYDGRVVEQADLLARRKKAQARLKELEQMREDIDRVSESLSALTDQIDAFLERPDRAGAPFLNAQAYEQVLRRFMDDDLFDEPNNTAVQ